MSPGSGSAPEETRPCSAPPAADPSSPRRRDPTSPPSRAEVPRDRGPPHCRSAFRSPWCPRRRSRCASSLRSVLRRSAAWSSVTRQPHRRCRSQPSSRRAERLRTRGQSLRGASSTLVGGPEAVGRIARCRNESVTVHLVSTMKGLPDEIARQSRLHRDREGPRGSVGLGHEITVERLVPLQDRTPSPVMRHSPTSGLASSDAVHAAPSAGTATACAAITNGLFTVGTSSRRRGGLAPPTLET